MKFRRVIGYAEISAVINAMAKERSKGETSKESVVNGLSDLQRDLALARAKPRHLIPQPKASLRAGLAGVTDALLSAPHVLEMFRRTLPDGASRRCLGRLSNRLTKIIAEARKLATP
jgi:hypothetical protein